MIIKKVGGTVRQAICDDLRTLIYLANQACVTPHLMAKRG
jgi:bifunctional non-homologous end joining protein LigD